ncbi:MAG TPA: sugar transferase, partial [Candidatus Dormibacteraeota bacterium]
MVAFNIRSAQVRGLGFAVPRIALGITLAVFFISAELVDAYRLSGIVNLRGTFRAVASSMSLSFIGLLLVFFVSPYRITRPTLIIWTALATACLLGWRIAYRQVFAGDIFAGSLAVVAQKAGFDRVWPDATGVMRGLYRVVEVVDPASPDCGDILRELVAEGRINQIILGVRDDVDRELFRTLIDCYDHGVPVRSLNDIYEELTGRLMLDQLGHSWLISLPMRSETSRLYAGFKRVVDIASGIVGLVVLAVILPFAAIAIKLDSPGPVFYRQARLGQYGRPFQILKLRTMNIDPAGKQRQTEAG